MIHLNLIKNRPAIFVGTTIIKCNLIVQKPTLISNGFDLQVLKKKLCLNDSFIKYIARFRHVLFEL